MQTIICRNNLQQIKQPDRADLKDNFDPELVTEIVNWISGRSIKISPVPLELFYFGPEFYNASECLKLIQIGANPKMGLYKNDDETRNRRKLDFTKKLSNVFTDYPDNFWFCLSLSDCESKETCFDDQNPFKQNDGFRVEKSESSKLGTGGFGTVYSGIIHGKPVAAKYVNVTQNYKNMFAPGTYKVTEILKSLLGDVAIEAQFQNKLDHPNIVKNDEFWIQCSNLTMIELVMSMERCECNLEQWLIKKPFDFAEIRVFLIQMVDALSHLEHIGHSHCDFKLANVLISIDNKNQPTAKLTDFGIVATAGLVTPVYCAPEQVKNNSVVNGSTDQHALAISILFCFYGKEDGMRILFGTLQSTLPSDITAAKLNPCIALIRDMLQYDPSVRPKLAEVQQRLLTLPSLSRQQTVSDLNLRLSRSRNVLSNTLELSYRATHLSIAANAQSVVVHDSIVSGHVHDQLQSYLCWCFSLSTIIRAEIIRLIKRLSNKQIISSDLTNVALKLASKLNEKDKLMYQIICLVVPRSPNLDDFAAYGSNQSRQMATSDSAMEKMCRPTLLRPAGWKLVPAIREITDLLTDNTSGKNINEIWL